MSDNDLSGLLPAPVIGFPLLVLSINASTDSCNILFSFFTIISGAFKSINLFKRLFLFITLLYRSFRSDVANLPPSNCTIGLKSGGITGITFFIILSGLFPDFINDSTVSSFFKSFPFLPALAFSNSFSIFCLNSSRFILFNSFSKASAPVSALNSPFGYFSFAAINSDSVNISHTFISLTLLSVTIYVAKYITLSNAFGDTSSINAILFGIPLKNQMWAIGAASSKCPILSLLTVFLVISTPASVTYYTLISYLLIFTTMTFPVFCRSKYFFTKKPIFFWF